MEIPRIIVNNTQKIRELTPEFDKIDRKNILYNCIICDKIYPSVPAPHWDGGKNKLKEKNDMKQLKRILAILLTLVMVLGLLPTMSFAAGQRVSGSGRADKVYTDEDTAVLDQDVFARIAAVEASTAQVNGGVNRMSESDYIALVPQVIKAIKESETYVPGSLQQNGNFLVWETTTGMPCCYDPRMEAELHNTVNDPSPAEIARIEAEA